MQSIRVFFVMLLGLLSMFHATSQPAVALDNKDTLVAPAPTFTPALAASFISRILERDEQWKDTEDPLRRWLNRLVEDYNLPFDSVIRYLEQYPFEKAAVEAGTWLISDTLPLRWLTPSSFIIDTFSLAKDPVFQRTRITVRALDTSLLAMIDTMPVLGESLLSWILDSDTITESVIDTAFLRLKGVPVHQVDQALGIIPAIIPSGSPQVLSFTPDSNHILIRESRQLLMGSSASPFFQVNSMHMPDSLKAAVKTLMVHAYQRDSVLLFVKGVDGSRTPFWLTGGKEDLQRLWVKNTSNDSVTLWMGNPARYDITLILEDGIRVERMEKRASDTPIPLSKPDYKLSALSVWKEVPVFWDYHLANAFSLNQNYLANWSRGGQSSLAGMLDISGMARYTNRDKKSRWTSTGRLKYGTNRTKEGGFRTSSDILEGNSQYNRGLREKLDFSAVLYVKTQVARGYQYPNDSVVVSKFLNPGAMTMGLGVEYKPVKELHLNFSPLSYRNTFVLDTASINQSLHGIEKDKKSRQEMGGQLVVRSSMEIMDGLKVNHAIRLFSSYLDKPQNVDIDWEMNLEQQINWLFTIRLNVHVIYDDDVRFPVLDEGGKPVLLPDGSPRKVARTQLNQFLGLTFQFKI